MAASDNLHPQQLGMFMQAKTIYEGGLNETFGSQRPNAKASLMRHKTGENLHSERLGTPLAVTLNREGVQTPLEMSVEKPTWTKWNNNGPTGKADPTLTAGHHRLAWAMNKDPKMELPVTWTDRHSQ